MIRQKRRQKFVHMPLLQIKNPRQSRATRSCPASVPAHVICQQSLYGKLHWKTCAQQALRGRQLLSLTDQLPALSAAIACCASSPLDSIDNGVSGWRKFVEDCVSLSVGFLLKRSILDLVLFESAYLQYVLVIAVVCEAWKPAHVAHSTRVECHRRFCSHAAALER